MSAREIRQRALAARAAKKGRGNTVMEEAFSRVGSRRAVNVLTFACQWSMVEADLGREFTVDEFADWWRVSLATGYRELDRWRQCFPEWSTPAPLLAVVRSTRKEPSLALFRKMEFAA